MNFRYSHPSWLVATLAVLLLAQSAALIASHRAAPASVPAETADETEAGPTASRSGSFTLHEESVRAKGGNVWVLSHRCDGTEVAAVPVPGGGTNYDAWCDGTNRLVIVAPDGRELDADSTDADSPETAVELSDVSYVPGSSTILFSFQHLPCSFEEASCGVGLPTNPYNYAFKAFVLDDLATNLRTISHFPERGTAIWNAAGTKAIFPVEQVGGAGCDEGPIVGYDLAEDRAFPATEETACQFQANGTATDVEGNPVPEWGPVKWTGDNSFASVVYETDGTWNAIEGTL